MSRQGDHGESAFQRVNEWVRRGRKLNKQQRSEIQARLVLGGYGQLSLWERCPPTLKLSKLAEGENEVEQSAPTIVVWYTDYLEPIIIGEDPIIIGGEAT